MRISLAHFQFFFLDYDICTDTVMKDLVDHD